MRTFFRTAMLMEFAHELCACGVCRCQHHMGYQFSLTLNGCRRYTWTSQQPELDSRHALAARPDGARPTARVA